MYTILTVKTVHCLEHIYDFSVFPLFRFHIIPPKRKTLRKANRSLQENKMIDNETLNQLVGILILVC